MHSRIRCNDQNQSQYSNKKKNGFADKFYFNPEVIRSVDFCALITKLHCVWSVQSRESAAEY